MSVERFHRPPELCLARRFVSKGAAMPATESIEDTLTELVDEFRGFLGIGKSATAM